MKWKKKHCILPYKKSIWGKLVNFQTTKVLLSGTGEEKNLFHYNKIKTAIKYDKICKPLIMLTQTISGLKGELELNM